MPSAAGTSCSEVDARSFRQRDRGTPPFALGFFGERQNSVVIANPLGSSIGVKTLVAEEKGVLAVRCLIKYSIRFLIDHISTRVPGPRVIGRGPKFASSESSGQSYLTLERHFSTLL